MRFSIVTLGCKVNAYESQFYGKALKEKGWTEDDENFDVIVVNTCAVTNTAAAKSRQMLHRAKKKNPDAYAVVIGCYAQVATPEEKEKIGADLLIGSKDKKKVADLIESHIKTRERFEDIQPVGERFDFEAMPIERFETKHRAFLKVQDGCNQFCSYCIIPYARGRERSLALDEVVSIAKQLEQKGHLEIVLTGIHTGRYDDGEHDLVDLLEALLANTSEKVTYRLSSIEITEISDRFIALMAREPRILHHLHIPVQSGCDATLKRMNRPYTIQEFQDRVEAIRHSIPDVSISTDVIAGFKQESDEEFEQTMENLTAIGFSFLHVFPYSIRKGTAAEKMPGTVHGAVVKERVERLLEQSRQLRAKDMARFKEGDVLIEQQEGDEWTGYTNQYHPVRIESEIPLSGRLHVTFDSIEDDHYQVKVKKEDENAIK
ncbi:tRNA (N(6)-L-threonylcarbamoyladenosine(37)-C(2))-methylthiotransferase MtaB [uncultured Dubosiella sp.]|uniref:tRNA (N(6)-L-threonylcarbamoyladenosine(37)-C(2))- methylthiotransferase MtaB n=4 Tax=uncultured Dubosiella sp. TaxID=1937011 RepID=UPI00258F5BC8|nr:tRNA (N(6)-L-threonylcarbamoyladenosine(37)-C(2))-methylthiotransferase MtaB [uncultured Dubosiella sp.]